MYFITHGELPAHIRFRFLFILPPEQLDHFIPILFQQEFYYSLSESQFLKNGFGELDVGQKIVDD